LKESVINLEQIEEVEFFGINNCKIKLIQELLPKLDIHVRGTEVKLKGDNSDVAYGIGVFEELHEYISRHETLPEKVINEIVTGDKPEIRVEDNDDRLILHGRNNVKIKARTINQYKLVKTIDDNDIVFAIGPAGTGKTYTSVALAVRALRNKEVKRIILTRPAVEAGENLGFLPGDMREKIDPYLRPLYDALDDMFPGDKMKAHLERKVIEIAPLAFMRGRTLDNAFVILDEAQNCTNLQLKMFLTRMGPTAKFIVTGDLTQIDLPHNQKSGLLNAINILNDVKGIDVLHFDVQDVTRHRIVKDIIKAYSKESKLKTDEKN